MIEYKTDAGAVSCYLSDVIKKENFRIYKIHKDRVTVSANIKHRVEVADKGLSLELIESPHSFDFTGSDDFLIENKENIAERYIIINEPTTSLHMHQIGKIKPTIPSDIRLWEEEDGILKGNYISGNVLITSAIKKDGAKKADLTKKGETDLFLEKIYEGIEKMNERKPLRMKMDDYQALKDEITKHSKERFGKMGFGKIENLESSSTGHIISAMHKDNCDSLAIYDSKRKKLLIDYGQGIITKENFPEDKFNAKILRPMVKEHTKEDFKLGYVTLEDGFIYLDGEIL
jgi:hypothetical protein